MRTSAEKALSSCPLALWGLVMLFMVMGVPACPAENRLIVPGKSVGPLRLDSTIEECIKILGNPTETEQATPLSSSKGYYFNEQNLVLCVESSKISGIIVNDRSYPTLEGIRVGSSLQEMEARYGTKDRHTSGSSLVYPLKGIAFIVEKEQITSIYIFKLENDSLRGDGLIIAGQRAGHLTLDSPYSIVERVWGPSDSSIKLLIPRGSVMHLFASRKGVLIITFRSRIDSVTIMTSLYRTPEGLQVGSLEQEVKTLYGQPAVAGSYYSYPEKGISFKITGKKVEEISITKPRK
ncbi:MAG: hypothetical protein RDV48_04710 [Candidatus Eremiobacteraeota bacterium]|nr:hypothetical protein [Candidatus Eremiobacteraeota bacterium]